MEKSEQQGMRTFDSALYHLYREGRISLEEALKNADSANNLRLKVSLAESEVGGDAEEEVDRTGGLSLVSDDSDEEEDNIL